jgi:hypothetical protein
LENHRKPYKNNKEPWKTKKNGINKETK